MNQNIPVRCLVNRSWNPRTRTWDGETVEGEMIDVLAQSAEDNPGKLIAVGVVMLETGIFESVPVEFITVG